MGIQRPFHRKRVREIAEYTDAVDACFPTSIVISIDDRCVTVSDPDADVSEISVSPYVDDEDADNSVPLSKAAWIIDGQHRLKGLEARNADKFQMPTTVFIGADEPTRAALFSVVNLAQTKVNRSIVFDLFALADKPSPQRSCHEITVALDKLDFSPFHHRIMRLGARTPGRELEYLAQATVVRGMLQYISRDPELDRQYMNNRGKLLPAAQRDEERLFLRPLVSSGEDDRILDIMVAYFGAIKERWKAAWQSREQGVMISRTNGFDGFMKFFPRSVALAGGINSDLSERVFSEQFRRSDLTDAEFNVQKFRPGSSGASELARTLKAQIGSS